MAEILNQPIYNLTGGQMIPQIGFGTWQLQDKEALEATSYALEVGYRHIDTAHAYNNHKEISKAIRQSGLSRESLFITTKLWRTHLASKDVRPQISKALDELDLDYINLYLIHWPNHEIPIQETLEALALAKEEGLIRAIGVSNFTISHLKEALTYGIPLENNQVEFHPSLNQNALKEFCDSQKISLTAYSPIAQGRDLMLKEVIKISDKYLKPRSQVIINWLLKKNMIVIPRSSKPKHILENLQAVQWSIDEEDLELLDSINSDNRIVNPDFAEFDYKL